MAKADAKPEVSDTQQDQADAATEVAVEPAHVSIIQQIEFHLSHVETAIADELKRLLDQLKAVL